MRFSIALLLAGAALIVTGCALAYPPLAYIVSGLALGYYALTREDGQ